MCALSLGDKYVNHMTFRLKAQAAEGSVLLGRRLSLLFIELSFQLLQTNQCLFSRDRRENWALPGRGWHKRPLRRASSSPGTRTAGPPHAPTLTESRNPCPPRRPRNPPPAPRTKGERFLPPKAAAGSPRCRGAALRAYRELRTG